MRMSFANIMPKPEKSKVNVTKTFALSIIPGMQLYAGWRVQKFWLVFAITGTFNAIQAWGGGLLKIFSEYGSSPYSFGAFIGFLLVATIINVLVGLTVVRGEARRWNKKIDASLDANNLTREQHGQ
jgi:hypothetical protein